MITCKEKNSSTITVVDAPEVSLTEDEKAGDALLKFFRELGWNGEDILDPCKIRTTKEVYNRLYDVMLGKCPGDSVGVGMLMVNRGPGTESYIPPGKVYLLDGWIKPVEVTKDTAHEPGTCPICGSYDLEYDGGEAEDEYYINKWECEKCGTRGRECYEMKFAEHFIDWKGDDYGKSV